jgi:hypothetical protein
MKSNGDKQYKLTTEQLIWLRQNYPYLPDKVCAERLNITLPQVRNYARFYACKKADSLLTNGQNCKHCKQNELKDD